mgnify:CR=1 FL=1
MVIQYASRCKGAHSDAPPHSVTHSRRRIRNGNAPPVFDVARPAGVSTAVVSYVLNGSPKKISPDTAQRVFDAAQWLDYHPNSVARASRPAPRTRSASSCPTSRTHTSPNSPTSSKPLHPTRTGADHQPVARRPARRAPPHQRTRRAQRRRDVRLLRADRCRARPLRGQRGARPRAHARPCSSSPPNSSPGSLRMQVTGRQVAANGSQ